MRQSCVISQHPAGCRSARSPLYISYIIYIHIPSFPRHPGQQHFLGCSCSRMASVLQDSTYDAPFEMEAITFLWGKHLQHGDLMNGYSRWFIKGIYFQRRLFWMSTLEFSRVNTRLFWVDMIRVGDLSLFLRAFTFYISTRSNYRALCVGSQPIMTPMSPQVV